MPLLKGAVRLLATLSFSFLFPLLDRKLLDSENRFSSHDPVVSELRGVLFSTNVLKYEIFMKT